MKFKLNCLVGVSAYTEVEADSLEEALEIAEYRGVVLGSPQQRDLDQGCWVINDADGTPQGITVEGVTE